VVEPVSNYSIHRREDSFNFTGKCLAQQVWSLTPPKLLTICQWRLHSRNAGQPISAATLPCDTPCNDSNDMIQPVVRLVVPFEMKDCHCLINTSSSLKAMHSPL